ncbi:MAG: DUF975 family protein [Lachnospiraceae bacterium]|nr:DUF975 family protein [Lachnospiraceae bacterium]
MLSDDVKERGMELFRERRGLTILACLIVFIVSLSTSLVKDYNTVYNFIHEQNVATKERILQETYVNYESDTTNIWDKPDMYLTNYVGTVDPILVLIIYVIATIFILNPLQVGLARFFLTEDEDEKHRASTVFWGFRNNYLNIVTVMFIRDVKILFWSLFCGLPGIIKAYKLYLVPYILSEDPYLSAGDVCGLSEEATYGEKFNIFITELTFIGWWILVFATIWIFGLGLLIAILFVQPYFHATMACVYKDLSKSVKEETVY